MSSGTTLFQHLLGKSFENPYIFEKDPIQEQI